MGLLEVIRVPGVGPRKAALFHREAQVNDLLTLESAALAGRLALLKGMGQKSERNILEGIALLRRSHGRILLSQARELADGVCEALAGDAPVIAAGSLRRGRETVGDLDLLTTTDNAGAMDRFVALESVETVVSRGPTRSTVVLRGGTQADLRVVPPESFGAALQYFTGSQQHNIRLREIAQARGLRLSEYGVFDENAGGDPLPRIAGETEQDVYRALGLAWVPPELREDAGEVAAAQTGTLPELVELSQIRGDFHCHTVASDGANTVEEMALAARARGWEYIVITDHSKALGIAGGLDETRLLAQVQHIRAVNEKLSGFRVLSGCEVDILSDGRLDISAEVLGELDFVVASLHSALGQEEARVTERIVRAALSPHVDCIAHPLGRVLGRRDESRLDFGAVIAACLEGRTALEINCFPDRLDLPDVRARMAGERGVLLALGTDAHSAAHQEHMVWGVTTARRGWLGPQHVLNSRSADEVLAWARGAA